MTKYLDVNDVLSALSASEHPRYDVHRTRLEHAVNLAAKDLASHFGLIVEKAETVWILAAFVLPCGPCTTGKCGQRNWQSSIPADLLIKL